MVCLEIFSLGTTNQSVNKYPINVWREIGYNLDKVQRVFYCTTEGVHLTQVIIYYYSCVYARLLSTN